MQWWNSGGSLIDAPIGTVVTLIGTVKAHDLDKFDQRPVTVLTRCKAVAA